MRIERDTGNSTIYFASGEKIEVKMNPDYPLTITDPDQLGIITTKIDPNLYYEHSPTPSPDPNSGSHWHWYDTFGVVVGSLAGTALIGFGVYVACKKYYQHGGAAPLSAESMETGLLGSVNIDGE